MFFRFSLSFAIHKNQLEQVFSNLKRKVNQPGGEEQISESLRGYKWEDLLVPSYLQLELPFNQIAYEYCDSGKYLYLHEVKGLPEIETLPRVRGRLIDSSLMELIKNTISYLKQKHNPHNLMINSFLESQKHTLLGKVGSKLDRSSFIVPSEKIKIYRVCESIINFEISLIESRIQYHVAKTIRTDMNSLIAHSLPVLINDVLSVKDMGFSAQMTPDFVFNGDVVVGEFKGFKRDMDDKAYRIAMAGYAMAYEKSHHVDVDVSCVLFLDLENTKETPLYDLDVFVVTDEYRKLFITKRDKMLNIVYKKIDPGLASKCPASCPYLTECNPSSGNIDNSK